MDQRLVALRDALPGQVIKGSGRVHYHIRSCIGEGGQGWVFTANWDEPGGFVVIVKVLRPDAVNADTLSRFNREADVLRMLSQQAQPNPHIVRFFDHASTTVRSPLTGEALTLPFTVLEYVSGSTLELLLEGARGGLALERVRRILRQVSQALGIVHGHNIVHRDLKPSNILLANDAGGVEVAKVTDFGLVKLVEVGLQRTTTLAGASLGYAPPEQYEQGNRRVSVRTDVFSLAAIVHEMLCGKAAFPYKDGENPLLIVTRIMNGPRPTLNPDDPQLSPELRRRPDVAAQVSAQLSRAMSPDPNDRHASVDELFNALEPLFKQAIGPSVPPRIELGETFPASMQGSAHLAASMRPSLQLQQAASRMPQSDLTQPSQWSWRIAQPPIRRGIVRSALFATDGSVMAVGPEGLARWSFDGWRAMSTPPALPLAAIRGMQWLPDGDILLYGDGGMVLRLTRVGLTVGFPRPDVEAYIHGAQVEHGSDTIVVVGERMSGGTIERTTSTERVGYVVVYHRGRIAFVGDAPPAGRLLAVARLGAAWAAVGDRGALVRIDGTSAEAARPICAGDLMAIATLPDGTCATVGAGGHALHLGHQGEAQLEAVQTTRDLVCLAVSEDGVAWAGSQARILRRTGDSWVRMNGELGLESTVVGLHVRSSREVRAVCDDGAVLEGRLGSST